MTEWDEFGIDNNFSNPRARGYKDIDIENANRYVDFWLDLGFEVIPCDSGDRGPWIVKGYSYDEPKSKEFYDHCKKIGVFVYGIAILLSGKLRHGKYKDKFVAAFDWDNQLGEEMLLSVIKNEKITIEDFAANTIVEKHKGSPNKGHAYLITSRAIANRPPPNSNQDKELEAKFDTNELPSLEIYSSKHLMTVTNSYKPDTKDYNARLTRSEFLGIDTLLELDELQTDQLENRLDEGFKRYGLNYLSNASNGTSQIPIEEFFKEDYRVHEGENRQLVMLRLMDHLIAKLRYSVPLESIKQLCQVENRRICVPPLEDKEFNAKWKEAVNYINREQGVYTEEEKELLKELDDLGIPRFAYDTENQELGAVVLTLGKNLDRFKRLDSSKHIDPASDQVMSEGIYKTLADTEEVLWYDKIEGIYKKRGEQKIKIELDKMRSKQLTKLDHLESLSRRLQHMIEGREKEGLDLMFLDDRQHALQDYLYEESRGEMIVRDNFRREVVGNVIYNKDLLVERDMFDTDPSIIVVKNGVLKLKFQPRKDGNEDLTWDLTNHSPKILSMTSLPVIYDPEAKCPMWNKFISEITGVNKKSRRNIQKMMGYCLYKSNKFQKSIILHGVRDNGKSVILYVIEEMVGGDNVSNLSLHDICDGNQFATSTLYGKMVNTCGDLDIKKILNTGRFKIIVTGDRLSIEEKGKARFSFRPTVKLVFAANEFPDCEDEGTAYYKRLVVIILDISIPEDQQDTNLKKKLVEGEMSGIFNFALEGLKMLLADGGFDDIGSLRDVKKMYKENADIVYAFVNRYYDFVPTDKDSFYAVPTEEVQGVFIDYLKKFKKDSFSRYLNLKIFDNSEDVNLDLENEAVRDSLYQVLGRELSSMGIRSRQLINKITRDRGYHYVGLKRKYGLNDKDGKPIIDEFIESGLEIEQKSRSYNRP